MVAKAVARIGDAVKGTCWGPGHDRREFTGTWATGSSTVKANGVYIIRLGDTGTTDCGHTLTASTASSVVKADGLYVHRVDDIVVVNEGGEGNSVEGSGTVSAL